MPHALARAQNSSRPGRVGHDCRWLARLTEEQVEGPGVVSRGLSVGARWPPARSGASAPKHRHETVSGVSWSDDLIDREVSVQVQFPSDDEEDDLPLYISTGHPELAGQLTIHTGTLTLFAGNGERLRTLLSPIPVGVHDGYVYVAGLAGESLPNSVTPGAVRAGVGEGEQVAWRIRLLGL